MGHLSFRAGLVLLAAAVAGCANPQADSTPDAARVAVGDVLSREKQERIWDYEHRSFALETHFGKRFLAALRSRRPERIATFLTDGFAGEVFTAGGGRVRQATVVRETVRTSETDARRPVDPAGFARHLVEWLDGLATIDRMAFKVLHIESAGAGGDRWSVQLMLEAFGRAAGGALVERTTTWDAEFRYREDEELKSGGSLNRATVLTDRRRTSPRALMDEVTEATGLAALPLPDNWTRPREQARMHRYLIAVEDFDRDGHLDIVVGSNEGPPLLLRSEGAKRFTDVAGAMGLQPPDPDPRVKDLNALATWIDYDNDGFPDLLLGYRLYHNVGGKRFEDVTAASGLKFDRVPFGSAVFDYDGDGRLDLYIIYQKGFRARPPGPRPWVGDTEAGAENHLWRNEGRGRFRDVTAGANAAGGMHQTFAAAVLFYDADPHPDLYLANDFGANVLLRNRGDGTFEDITQASGTGDFATSMGVSSGDLDNDGAPELYVANMYSKMGRRIIAHVDRDDYRPGLYEMIRGSLAGNRLYRQVEGGGCEELSEDLGINQVGWAFAPAMVDLDGDGWLDLYATAGFISSDRTKPDG